MKIQVTRYADVVVIEGDEAKLAEMVSIHGAANVVNLDTEVIEVNYPEPEQVAAAEEVPADPAPEAPGEPAAETTAQG